MKAREYDVLEMAVEDGVDCGWMRAHKHVDRPDEESVKEEICRAVMGEICTWFDLDVANIPGDE